MPTPYPHDKAICCYVDRRLAPSFDESSFKAGERHYYVPINPVDSHSWTK